MISSTGSSSNAVSYTSLQNSINSLAADKVFRKPSGKSGDGSLSVAKNPTETQIGSSHSDKNQSVSAELKKDNSNITYLKTKTEDDSVPQIDYGSHNHDDEEIYYDGKASATINSFDSLAAEIGAIGDKISKVQLVSYLNELTTDPSNAASNSGQIAFVKNLIAKFDTIAKGQEYLTSLTGLNDAQDYTTVTPEQVTPPFDLRV